MRVLSRGSRRFRVNISVMNVMPATLIVTRLSGRNFSDARVDRNDIIFE